VDKVAGRGASEAKAKARKHGTLPAHSTRM